MRKLLLILSVTFLSCSSGQALRKPDSVAPSTILLVSDIHLDPFYDPVLVQRLKDAKNGSEWSAIFERSSVTGPSRPGNDPNYPLFKASLAAMKAAVPEPKTILIAGDFLRHGFVLAVQTPPGLPLPKEKNKKPNTVIDPAVQDFAVKTIQFIAESFRGTFPDAQILAAAGNNDSACGDYEFAPNEVFLSAMAEAFAPSSGTADFVSQFSGSGHFSTRLAAYPNVQVLAMNDVSWSRRYVNGCGKPSSNPAEDEMTWLEAKLKEAQDAGQRIWLLNHVPAGIDIASIVYGKLKVCETGEFPMMLGTWNSPFLALVAKYRSSIAVNISGHTHSNEFRIYGAAGNDPLPAFVVPSISPLHENNPAFQTLEIDSNTGEIENLNTYSLDLSGPADSLTPWRPSSDFKSDYSQAGPSGAGLIETLGNLKANPEQLKAYILRMNSGAQSPAAIAQKNATAFLCGISNLETESYKNCYCDGR